jgi:3-hydroxyisobutyrate dehydrogenase
MGGRAAVALAERYPVHGFDPVPAARDLAGAGGVETYDELAPVITDADLIFLSLPTPEIVRWVITDLGGSVNGKIIADLSTIDPGTAREVAVQVADQHGSYLDTPILGRPAGCGQWTLACGGAEADVAKIADIAIGSIAKSVERVGDVGAGATLKILNNLMFGAINTITAEIVSLAERAGVDPARFAEIVGGSGAASVSGLFRDIAPRMAAHRYDDPTFAIRLLAKDVRLGSELAASLDRPAPMADLVRTITERAVESGLGGLDTAAVVEIYRRQDEAGPRTSRS